MRLPALIPLAVLCVTAAFAPTVRGDDGEDGKSSDDLFTYRRTGRSIQGGKVTGWTAWWYANRTNLIAPSYRAREMSAGTPAPVDAEARERGREALLEALADDHWLIASEAALALGRFGDERDIKTLSKIVLDPAVNETRRKHRYAALGLGMLPLGDRDQAADARAALLEALGAAAGEQDRFSYFRANCAYALAMRGDVAALAALSTLRRKALAGPGTRATIHADVLGPMCYAIGVLGGADALPEVEEQLHMGRVDDAGSKDPSWSACHALARIGGPKATLVARVAAADPERETVRTVALAVLGTLAGPADDDSAAVLRAALTATDSYLLPRGMAAVALGRTGHASAADALLPVLEKGHEMDRPFAALGLGFLGRAKPDPKFSAALEHALAEDSAGEELRAAAALACGLAGVATARERLTALLGDDKSPECAAQAAFALGLLGAGAKERAALRAAVTRRGLFELRREAALALGMLRDAQVVHEMRAIVASKTAGDVDRATAAYCLGRVGDDSDIDLLVRTLRDRDSSKQLRAATVHGLGWLLDRGAGQAALGRVTADTLWFMLPRSSYYNEPIHDLQHIVD
jgi:HEAT repeat protein